jgi:hypothetical protein
MLRVYGRGNSSRASRAGCLQGSLAGPRLLNGPTMNQYRNPHEREAARLRLLLANSTTPRVKSRLLDEVEKLDQIAEGLDVPAVP